MADDPLLDDSQPNDQASRPDPFQNRDDGFFNAKRDEPHLPQDYDTPASPPTDVKEQLPKDFPETDTSVEPSAVYDEGINSATGIDTHEENNKDNEVV